MKLKEELIHAAIDGFNAQKSRIDAQIAELRATLSGSAQSDGVPEAAPRKRRKFSAATLRRMRKAQRLRWAKIRGESVTSAPAVKVPKRKLSASGRKAIVDALKRRWALKRLEVARAKKNAPARKKALKTAAA